MHVETLANKASLSSVRRLIRSELNKMGAPPAQAFDCLVAVTEACTNALLHGRSDPDCPPPKIKWEIERATARFEIRDYSNEKGAEPNPADLAKVPPPRDGGYGLQMMRQLMDEVDIDFSSRGTTVSMSKTFSLAPA